MLLAYANIYVDAKLAYANKVSVFERMIKMNLWEADEGKEYIISGINTEDEELSAFLFSLGCYSGEPITVVYRQKKSCTVSIKDSRYSIDMHLAQAIEI